MSTDSIRLIYKIAALLPNPRQSRNVVRGITRAFRQSLMAYSWRQTEEASKDIRACLEPSKGWSDPCGAYAILQCWYWHASAQAPKSSWTYMENFSRNLQTLYQRKEPHPPGLPLATHVDLAKVKNKIPLYVELEVAVRRLLPHGAGGHTHLCAEQFKKWRQEDYPGEQSKNPLRRELWLCLVDLVQHMWLMGEIPQELGWTILVLIPKETTDTRDISLLETLWKVVEALINTRLRAILQMHNVLHEFRA